MSDDDLGESHRGRPPLKNCSGLVPGERDGMFTVPNSTESSSLFYDPTKAGHKTRGKTVRKDK